MVKHGVRMCVNTKYFMIVVVLMMQAGMFCAGGERSTMDVDGSGDESRFLRISGVVAQRSVRSCSPRDCSGAPIDWAADYALRREIEMTKTRSKRTLGDSDLEEGAARGGGAASQHTPEILSACQSRDTSPISLPASLTEMEEELGEIDAEIDSLRYQLSILTARMYALQNPELALEMLRIYDKKKKCGYPVHNFLLKSIGRDIKTADCASLQEEKSKLLERRQEFLDKKQELESKMWRTSQKQEPRFSVFGTGQRRSRSSAGVAPVVAMPWRESAESEIDRESVAHAGIDHHTRDMIRVRIQNMLSSIDHEVFDTHTDKEDTHQHLINRIRFYNVVSDLNTIRKFLTRSDIVALYDAAHVDSEISAKDAHQEAKTYFNTVVAMHNDAVSRHNETARPWEKIEVFDHIRS